MVKAEKSAIKATQRKAATQISRKVREEYNVTARAIADRLKLRLSPDNTEAYLWYIGTRIGLINFSGSFRNVRSARGKRFGATAKIKKKGSRFITVGGFIATGRNGNTHIFQRKDLGQKGRLPIQSKTGPAIPQMVDTEEVLSSATKYVEQEYPKDLINRLNFYLQKQMGK